MGSEMHGSYKEHHIELMHSNGTTACETFTVILPTYLAAFITILLDSLFSNFLKQKLLVQFLIEFVILVVPVILSLTVLSKYLKHVIITLSIVIVNVLLLIFHFKPSKFLSNRRKTKTDFLTNARSTINILSVTAILAVDFNVFPRYFVKTESFGYSLMDVGVGLFMYSNGIVASEARLKKKSLKTCIKSSLPLFVLGIARFLFVKQTDYLVPVSEYGVHWNFFITLGITKIVCGFVLNIINIKYIFIYAIFIIISHELLLQLGLQKFVLMNPKREDFITANREGLVSSLGYISIYLFSVSFGYCLHIKKEIRNKFSMILTFVIYSAITLIVSLILQYYFGISRKLANSSYCFWVLFIGVFMTGLYYSTQLLLEFLFRNKLQYIHSPVIFEAINYNGLSFFLIGNLLTGIINISLNTLTISNHLSLIILLLYMFVNCLIVTLLYFKQYKFKL